MKQIKIYTVIAVVALLAISCEKWLDVMPKTMQDSELMFDSYQGYKDALMGCYVKMKDRKLWGEHMTITSVEYLAQHWELWDESTAEGVRAAAMKKYDYIDGNVKPVIKEIYGSLFNIIVQANTIIEAIPLTGETAIEDPDSRGVVEGEAYAIRALCHFEILRLFGQVPGGTRTVRLPFTGDVSREPSKYYDYADYIRLIEEDLKKAEQLLAEHDPFMEYTVPEVNGTTVTDPYLRYRQLRLNYWAVKALQARFYLYTGNTGEAHKAADAVIQAANNGKGFNLAGGPSAIDNIADKYYALPGEGLFMLSNHNIADYITTLFRGTANNTTRVNLYMSTERMEGTADIPGLFGEPYAASTNNRFKSIWNRKQSMYSGVLVFEPMKYDQIDASGMTPMNLMLYKQVMPMLRLSEMYLIDMETRNDLAEINTLYTAYQRARDIAPVQLNDMNEVRDMIEKEYRREFFGEGQMFGFYKRHKATSMWWKDEAISEDNYIIPLPDGERDPNR